MDDRCIALCDSGVGGLVLLKRLKDFFPSEDFLYFSDEKNFPYGDKTANEIREIASKKIKSIMTFSPKLIVLACNTLSATVLKDYSTNSVKVLGVLPFVPKGKRTLLVATQATLASDYVKNLYKNRKADVFAAKGLADEIESWIIGGKEPNLSERFFSVDRNYDCISLGCTHYSLISDEFRKIFPNSEILDGADLTFDKIKGLVPTIEHSPQAGSVVFFSDRDKYVFSLLNKRF